MLKKAIVLLSLLGTVSAHAAVLDVSCEAAGAKKLALSIDIRNVNGDYSRPTISLNGTPRDARFTPVYKLVALDTNGSFDIGVDFDKRVSSVKSITMNVKNCMAQAMDPTKDPSSIYFGGIRENSNNQKSSAVVVEIEHTYSEVTTDFNCKCKLK